MEYTVIFKHGRCVGTFPPLKGKYYDRRDIIYDANTIISDGRKYDLTDKDSIYSIAFNRNSELQQIQEKRRK